MSVTIASWTFELTRSHLFFRAAGWEGLLDFTGQVGSILNRC